MDPVDKGLDPGWRCNAIARKRGRVEMLRENRQCGREAAESG